MTTDVCDFMKKHPELPIKVTGSLYLQASDYCATGETDSDVLAELLLEAWEEGRRFERAITARKDKFKR